MESKCSSSSIACSSEAQPWLSAFGFRPITFMAVHETANRLKARCPTHVFTSPDDAITRSPDFFLVRSYGFLNYLVNSEAAHPSGHPIEEQVDDRSCVQSEDLADQQSSDDRDAEWTAQLRSRSGTERQRQSTKHRSKGCHQDWAEAKQASLIDRVAWRFTLVAFCFQRKIDHHDGILLHNADQQDDADQCDY